MAERFVPSCSRVLYSAILNYSVAVHLYNRDKISHSYAATWGLSLCLKGTILTIDVEFLVLFISKDVTYQAPSEALSLCLRFLNQLETWVVVRPVPSASSRFSLGLG